MKKKRIFIIIFLIIGITNFFSQSITTEASENSKQTSFQDKPYNIQKLLDNDTQRIPSITSQNWITSGNKINYPITPNSEDWKNLNSHAEMVKACTIPDELLDKISTQELIELVMDYPLLGNLYFYDTYEQGLYSLVENFNGLRELLTRNDGIAKLIEYYKNYKLPTKLTSSENTINDKLIKTSRNDFKTIANIELTETLLVNDIVVDNCNQTQLNEIANIAYKKYIDKTKNDLFSGKENFIYKAAEEVNNTNPLGIISNKNSLFAAKNNTTYVTTPKGTKVPVYTSSYAGAQWSKTITAETKKEYPKATVIRPADNRYNCHSYAWYNQGTGNVYWMQSPASYYKDGSYKKITNKADRGANNRIIWLKAPLANPIIHSGFLVNINKNGSYNIHSKWGQGPLMQHNAKYSPYDGTRYYYKKAN